MNILSRMQYEIEGDMVSYSGFLEDCEGELIYVHFGRLPNHKDVYKLNRIPFEYIAASLLLEAKRNNISIDSFDFAICSLLERNVVLEIKLNQIPTTSFVDINGFLIFPKRLNLSSLARRPPLQRSKWGMNGVLPLCYDWSN